MQTADVASRDVPTGEIGGERLRAACAHVDRSNHQGTILHGMGNCDLRLAIVIPGTPQGVGTMNELLGLVAILAILTENTAAAPRVQDLLVVQAGGGRVLRFPRLPCFRSCRPAGRGRIAEHSPRQATPR